jgi:large subunit ribosomal protein L17
LVSDARRYGDQNKDMMEMADFWLLEKQLVHKLFKVVCPRFRQTFDGPYTNVYNAPRKYPSETERRQYFKRIVLELKGNPFPKLLPQASYRSNKLIHNVLLDAAMKDFNMEKAKSNANQRREEAELTAQDTTGNIAKE